MQIQVTILSVSVEDKGKYKQADVAYKDNSGKVSGKKLMSFTYPEVFNTIASASTGAVFDVTMKKNDKGYWDWTEVIAEGSVPHKTETKGTAVPRSNYETPEERAQRQVYIIRQSSLSTAQALLAANGGKKNTAAEVISIAREFEDYVFNKDTKTNSGFEDLENDPL